jgi:hypothetical protein
LIQDLSIAKTLVDSALLNVKEAKKEVKEREKKLARLDAYATLKVEFENIVEEASN